MEKKLNKPLSWKMLLIVGFILHTVAYFLTQYNEFLSAIGVIGDIMFLLGIVNWIVYLVKKQKDKKKEQ